MAGLSVVIATRAGDEYLKSFLEQLMQTLAPMSGVEIIVVSDTPDETVSQWCRGLGTCLYHTTGGPKEQFNLGATKAQGDLFLFLFCDTQLPKDFPEVWRLARQEDVVWGYFCLSLSDQAWRYRLLSKLISWRSRVNVIAGWEQGIFVHRQLWQVVGGFDETPLPDIALCQRLKRLSKPCVLRRPIQASADRWYQRGFFRTVLSGLVRKTGFWDITKPYILPRERMEQPRSKTPEVP